MNCKTCRKESEKLTFGLCTPCFVEECNRDYEPLDDWDDEELFSESLANQSLPNTKPVPLLPELERRINTALGDPK